MKTTSLIAFVITLVSLGQITDAFWRLPCHGRTGVARIDPIVNPGTIGAHVHAIHGGGNFGPDSTAADLLASNCTSCAVTQDKSAYWAPSLYFMYDNGTTVMVNQIGGMLAYYLLNTDGTPGQKITAFPNGFQMLAGDASRRNFTCAVPEPEKSAWSGFEITEPALRQKALGFNCLNYLDPSKTEGSLQRHFMPNKTFIDEHCLSGLRLELMFPSCWNGKDLDSKDHKAHVAYPNLVMNGYCPPGFSTRLPSLFYETIWDTTQFKHADGQFVLSNGDPTGYGYHGDFIAAWDEGVLQRAVDTCTNLSGQVQDCAVFNLQSDAEANTCAFSLPSRVRVLAADDVFGPRDGLPGGVPVQAGPGPATLAAAAVVASASSAVASAAVAAAASPSTTGVTTRTITSTASSSSSAAAVVAATFTDASPSSVLPVRVVTTVAAMLAPTPAPSFETTMWSTASQEVWEIYVEVVTVTTTMDLPSTSAGARLKRNVHLGRHRQWAARHGHAAH